VFLRKKDGCVSAGRLILISSYRKTISQRGRTLTEAEAARAAAQRRERHAEVLESRPIHLSRTGNARDEKEKNKHRKEGQRTEEREDEKYERGNEGDSAKGSEFGPRGIWNGARFFET